jgi:tetratricopeptide (TPR) repeat protein
MRWSCSNAAAVYRAQGDLEQLGRITAEMAWVHKDRGTPVEGLVQLEPMLAALASRGLPRTLAGLYAVQAQLLYQQDRYSEQFAAAVQAERHARAVDDTRHLTEALVTRGEALYSLGRMREALEALAEAVPVAEHAGAPYIQCFALMMTGSIQEECGEFEANRQVTERALRIAARQDDRLLIALLTTRRGMSAFYMGAWGAARRDYEQAVAICREVGPFWGSVYPFLDLGRLCLAEGAWSEASLHLEECERLLRSSADFNARMEVATVLAERDILEGHPDAAQALLAPLLDGREHEVKCFLQPRMAWALLAMGKVEEAAEIAGQVSVQAQGEGRYLALIDALRILGLVRIRQARWQDADSVLQDGLSLARRLHYPYAEARFLQAYGELLVQIRQHGPARERLEAALILFQRLGARQDASWTAQLLTTLA